MKPGQPAGRSSLTKRIGPNRLRINKEKATARREQRAAPDGLTPAMCRPEVDRCRTRDGDGRATRQARARIGETRVFAADHAQGETEQVTQADSRAGLVSGARRRPNSRRRKQQTV